MKPVALVLVLCLTGPAVATAVCEWKCARANHHEASAAAAGCHEQQSSAGTRVTASAADAACHRDAEFPTAVITAELSKAITPAILQASPIASIDRPEISAFALSASVRPPDLISITTTPLRI